MSRTFPNAFCKFVLGTGEGLPSHLTESVVPCLERFVAETHGLRTVRVTRAVGEGSGYLLEGGYVIEPFLQLVQQPDDLQGRCDTAGNTAMPYLRDAIAALCLAQGHDDVPARQPAQ